MRFLEGPEKGKLGARNCIFLLGKYDSMHWDFPQNNRKFCALGQRD